MSKRRTAAEEAAIAAYYEQHQDDADEWGEPVEPPMQTTLGGLETTVTVRFSAEDAARLRRLASKTERTHSDILRRALRAYEEQTKVPATAATEVSLTPIKVLPQLRVTPRGLAWTT